MMNKETVKMVKVDIFFFEKNALTLTKSLKKPEGELYLEKRPMGKFLCYEKADVVTAIKLTKKTYKNLKRFTSEIKLERFYNLGDEYMEDEWDVYNQDDEPTEDDMYYIKSRMPQTQINLPVVINTPRGPKTIAPFVVQVFKYVGKIP